MFLEIQMPTAIARGAKGGPRRSTKVIRVASGAEQRVSMWAESLRHWDVSHALRTNVQRDALFSFWEVADGQANEFRFKDWSNFQVKAPTPLDVIDSSTFQLVQRFVTGSHQRVRTITKPVSDTLGDAAADAGNSTVRIYTNTGSPVAAGWTVDCSTGIVTFNAPPGYVPQWTGEFDVPCRFASDDLEWSQDEVTYGTWPVQVVEVRI